MNEITRIVLKNGDSLSVKNADVSKYLADNKFFRACKKDTVEYLIPAENILYIETYAE